MPNIPEQLFYYRVAISDCKIDCISECESLFLAYKTVMLFNSATRIEEDAAWISVEVEDTIEIEQNKSNTSEGKDIEMLRLSRDHHSQP
jgi:hypothetical protein